MIELRDDHGQPLTRNYSAKRLNDRAIDELIGISKGLIADKTVNQREAEFLKSWLEANTPFSEDPIINQLYCRISDMLIDGILDQDEQKELLVILNEFTGESIVEHCANFSTSLPLCTPVPIVEFTGKRFCLTGKFAYAPRKVCEEVVLERGGVIESGVTQRLNYLVIGTFSSTDWIHTSYGRKIEKAVEYRVANRVPFIISEDTWSAAAFKGVSE